MWVGGGAARSEKWMQLRADIWGCRVERMQNIEVSSVGAALLAAVKVELYQDIKSAARSMLHIRDSYEPSKDISDRYELKYRQYLELVSNGIKTGEVQHEKIGNHQCGVNESTYSGKAWTYDYHM